MSPEAGGVASSNGVLEPLNNMDNPNLTKFSTVDAVLSIDRSSGLQVRYVYSWVFIVVLMGVQFLDAMVFFLSSSKMFVYTFAVPVLALCLANSSKVAAWEQILGYFFLCQTVFYADFWLLFGFPGNGAVYPLFNRTLVPFEVEAGWEQHHFLAVPDVTSMSLEDTWAARAFFGILFTVLASGEVLIYLLRFLYLQRGKNNE